MNRKQYPRCRLAGLILLVMTVMSCNNAVKDAVYDSPNNGTINISVDESFQPVIAEQIRVYEALHPGTHIIAHYKTEADCFRDLYKDTSNRMIIVTRGLTIKESRFYNDSLGYSPISDKIASDAITLVVNSSSKDSVFTIKGLQDQLSGVTGAKGSIIFDGLNATSTVRYAIDSILRGQQFDTSVVKAVKNSSAVLDYVAANPGAIGILGISWIGNPEDSTQLRMLKKVKIAWVQCEYCVDSPYVKPTQAGILSRKYPLVRGLYYILKENYNGLGSGLVGFLKSEKGQLIFRRAYLGPVMDFGVRTVKINEKL